MVKYIILIFSDRMGKPSDSWPGGRGGYGGLCHNVNGYLKPLVKKATQLNRIAVFQPPWISLSICHNSRKSIPKDLYWDDFFDLSKINNVALKNNFSYKENGDIITDKSIVYYPSQIKIDKIDNNYDIIALVNYSNLKTKKIRLHTMLGKSEALKFNISNKLKILANRIIVEFELVKFACIHIRRTDFLHKTRSYTSPKFVSNFIKKKICKDLPIIICTDEKDVTYKQNLIKFLPEYNLIFESNLFKNIIDEVNNNYSMYCILHELAMRSTINIGTFGYVRLGKHYHYLLSKQK